MMQLLEALGLLPPGTAQQPAPSALQLLQPLLKLLQLLLQLLKMLLKEIVMQHLVLPMKKISHQMQIKVNSNNKTMDNHQAINKDVPDATNNLNNKTGGTIRTTAGVQVTTADKTIQPVTTLIFLPSSPSLEEQ